MNIKRNKKQLALSLVVPALMLPIIGTGNFVLAEELESNELTEIAANDALIIPQENGEIELQNGYDRLIFKPGTGVEPFEVQVFDIKKGNRFLRVLRSRHFSGGATTSALCQ